MWRRVTRGGTGRLADYTAYLERGTFSDEGSTGRRYTRLEAPRTQAQFVAVHAMSTLEHIGLPPLRNSLARELENIRTLLLQMFVRAESMVGQAVRSVMERDFALARQVLASDRELNRLEIDVDSRCLTYLARWHPVGRDLRFVAIVMKMVTDVERIGDIACNIAKRGLELGGGSGFEPTGDLRRMGDMVVKMIRRASEAFVGGDVEASREVIASDEEVDACNIRLFRRWAKAMGAHPDQVERALAYCSVSKSLERIADHTVNLAQMVIFLVEGRDVRHQS